MLKLWTILIISLLAVLTGISTAAVPAPSTADNSPGIVEHLGDHIAEATLLDERGHPVELRDLLTKPTILLPVYYTCPSVCNVLQGSMTRILPKVALKPGVEYQVISISFDHTNTPELATRRKTDFLAAMGGAYPEDAWRFLTGSEEEVGKVMDSIGFSFRWENKQYIHPVVVVGVAPGGKIVRYLYGYDLLPFDLTMAMTEAAQGKTGLSVKRVLAYCFSYDPEGKKYVVNFMRVSGIVIFVLLIFLFLAVTLTRRKSPQKDVGS